MEVAEHESPSATELLSQGRLICAVATVALKETVDAEGVEDGRYSPETTSGIYSPSTPISSEAGFGWGDDWQSVQNLPGLIVDGQHGLSMGSFARRVLGQSTTRGDTRTGAR